MSGLKPGPITKSRFLGPITNRASSDVAKPFLGPITKPRFFGRRKTVLFPSRFYSSGLVKLLCHANVVCFVWLERFWGLTSDFAGFFGYFSCKRLKVNSFVMHKRTWVSPLSKLGYTGAAMGVISK